MFLGCRCQSFFRLVGARVPFGGSVWVSFMGAPREHRVLFRGCS